MILNPFTSYTKSAGPTTFRSPLRRGRKPASLVCGNSDDGCVGKRQPLTPVTPGPNSRHDTTTTTIAYSPACSILSSLSSFASSDDDETTLASAGAPTPKLSPVSPSPYSSDNSSIPIIAPSSPPTTPRQPRGRYCISSTTSDATYNTTCPSITDILEFDDDDNVPMFLLSQGIRAQNSRQVQSSSCHSNGTPRRRARSEAIAKPSSAYHHHQQQGLPSSLCNDLPRTTRARSATSRVLVYPPPAEWANDSNKPPATAPLTVNAQSHAAPATLPHRPSPLRQSFPALTTSTPTTPTTTTESSATSLDNLDDAVIYHNATILRVCLHPPITAPIQRAVPALIDI